jgi:hypothetical protein
MKINRLIAAAGTIAAFALPVAVQAQPVPQYASTEQQIRGTVASIGDKYTVYVRDERGYVDTVRLHDGTIINPTGLTLASGQSVTIMGRADGKAFDANEIDTPYSVDDGGGDYAAIDVAPYAYESYYPAYALSYPAFVSLGFGFGGGYGYYGGGYYGHGGYYGRGYYGHGGYYGNGYNHAGYGSRYPLGGSYRGSVGGYRSNANGGYHGATSSGFRAGASSSAHFSGGGFHGGGGSHH